MIIRNGNILIEEKDLKNFTFQDNFCKLNIEGLNVMFDVKIMLRVYEALKHEIEKSNMNFEDYLNNLN